MRVLACNAGSATLKLSLYEDSGDGWHRLATGTREGPASAQEALLQEYLETLPAPDAIIHRVVHAGPVTESLAVLDEALLACINHWLVLAPAHNSAVLQQAGLLARLLPQVPQYAAFDSGLYADLPAAASLYALPTGLSPDWPIRRYGFHGLAHRSQWRQVKSLLPQAAGPGYRLISLQLGSGCSWTAWQGDKPVDTSMGFTPLEGLVMAKRSGSIDPGILLHLLLHQNVSPERLQQILASESGLAALGQGSGDIRELLAAGSETAETALSHFCLQVRKGIGAAMAALGGVDAISFGGGMAENSAVIRARILSGLEGLGILVDTRANELAQGACCLHQEASETALCLTPVNEMEEMIRQYATLMNLSH